MDYNQLFKEIYREIKDDNRGEVATYIPELGKVAPGRFGVFLSCNSGDEYGFGDFREKFSIQSIAKVPALTLAYRKLGGALWQRVGVEPSGTAFNSLVQLEYDSGIPRNPFINAGALVVCDVLISEFEDPEKELLGFVRLLAGDQSIGFNEAIARSEKETGYRNAAMAHLMKSFGNIRNEVDRVLDFYFHLCSVEMTARQLSHTFRYLSHYGVEPHSGQRQITVSRAKRINAVMQLCGLYDEAGEFAFRVGLPGKSGVGGGIVAVHPGSYTIAVWSPRLNPKGNSHLGMRFLEEFTTRTEKSVF